MSYMIRYSSLPMLCLGMIKFSNIIFDSESVQSLCNL
jgi:hypothetical protein